MENFLRPEADSEVIDQLSRVVAGLVQHDRMAARAYLEPLVGVTCQTHPIVKMPVKELASSPAGSGALTRSPSRQVIASVYVRDSFTCRYCGRRTLPNQILRLISAAFPNEFPFHPNWRRDVAPRAYWDISTSLDHVTAVALGGDVHDASNLATACSRCQYQKSSRPLQVLGWTLHASAPTGSWDGLLSAYENLWEAVGRPNERHHLPWMKAYTVALTASPEAV